MVYKPLDLTGHQYNRLLVLYEAERRGYRRYWRCNCECGRETIVEQSNLRTGSVKSCGCLAKEILAGNEHGLRHGHKRVGLQTKTYKTWVGMFERTTNTNNPRYKDYGGRGIKVCRRWNNFENFLEDMGEKPDGLSIDRINNNGNYEPGNCRWATPKQQSNNQRKRKSPRHR